MLLTGCNTLPETLNLETDVEVAGMLTAYNPVSEETRFVQITDNTMLVWCPSKNKVFEYLIPEDLNLSSRLQPDVSVVNRFLRSYEIPEYDTDWFIAGGTFLRFNNADITAWCKFNEDKRIVSRSKETILGEMTPVANLERVFDTLAQMSLDPETEVVVSFSGFLYTYKQGILVSQDGQGDEVPGLFEHIRPYDVLRTYTHILDYSSIINKIRQSMSQALVYDEVIISDEEVLIISDSGYLLYNLQTGDFVKRL